MTVKTKDAEINTSYVVEQDDDRSSYPALQADIYQPRSLNEAISIGLSEDSFNMLPESTQASLNVESKTAFFGENEVLFFGLTGVRVVLLSNPKLFVVNKDTNEYSHLRKGMKLAGTKNVTIAKLFVLLVNEDGSFVVGHEGTPQVFTLNLKSSKTNLLGNSRSQPGDGTVASLNAGLRKHYKVAKGWLGHLVSLQLVAVPQKFTSNNGKDSSFGIMFKFEGSAKVLPESMQKQAFDLLQDETLRAIMADPFGLGTATVPTSAHGGDVDFDEDMPF